MIGITGSSGFIGSWLLRRLVANGQKVRVLLRATSSILPEHSNAEIVYGDVRDATVIHSFVKGLGCIVHLANVYQHKASGIGEMTSINQDAAGRLFTAAAESGVKRIVYASTAGVHEPVAGVIDENTPLQYETTDPYERQKIKCEQMLTELGRTGALETVILRPATVYGSGDLRLASFFHMIRSGKFFFIGNGLNHVSWVYIGDLIDAMESAATHPDAAGQAFLITGPETPTLRQLSAQVAEIFGVKPPALSLPVPPFRLAADLCEAIFPRLGVSPPIYRARLRFFTDDRIYSAAKARATLRVSLDTTLKEGLRNTLSRTLRKET